MHVLHIEHNTQLMEISSYKDSCKTAHNVQGGFFFILKSWFARMMPVPLFSGLSVALSSRFGEVKLCVCVQACVCVRLLFLSSWNASPQ